tara:strand:+ start:1310 stop:1453 length:144 start_codon:yes stop_codon:yes gene_type:complete
VELAEEQDEEEEEEEDVDKEEREEAEVEGFEEGCTPLLPGTLSSCAT